MARNSPAPPQTTEEEPSFEQAMEELEAIVHVLEAERLPLEELVGRYERGMNLLRVCQERLDHAQQSISLITAGASGRPAIVPFTAATAAGPLSAAVFPPALASAPAPPSPAPAVTVPTDDEIRLF